MISGQGWSKLGSSSFRNCDKRIRRESSSTLILPDYGGEFDYQYDPPQLIYVPVTWPTKAGKTKAEVETRCQKEVKESDAGKICAVIADFPFSSFIQQCVEDVQVCCSYILFFIPAQSSDSLSSLRKFCCCPKKATTMTKT